MFINKYMHTDLVWISTHRNSKTTSKTKICELQLSVLLYKYEGMFRKGQENLKDAKRWGRRSLCGERGEEQVQWGTKSTRHFWTLLIRRFWGLRSRWRMRCEWQYARPRSSCSIRDCANERKKWWVCNKELVHYPKPMAWVTSSVSICIALSYNLSFVGFLTFLPSAPSSAILRSSYFLLHVPNTHTHIYICIWA